MNTVISETIIIEGFRTTRADEAIMKRYGTFGAEAEAYTISAMLDDRDLALLGVRVLKRDYFLLPSRKAIFHAMSEIAQGDYYEGLIDPVRIQDTLRRLGYDEVAKDVSGIFDYMGLTFRTDARANLIGWCEMVIKAWSRRRMAALANKAIGDALSFDKEIEEVYTDVEEAIRELRSLGARGITLTAEEIVNSILSRTPEERAGRVLPTGFAELDKLLKSGGTQEDDFTMIAAPSFQGKTTLTSQIISNMCANGAGVLWFPLEVSYEATVERIVDLRARISFDAEQDGTLSEDDFRRRRLAAAEVASWNLRVSKTSIVSIPAIFKEVSMKQNEMKVDAVVVDHLGLITPDRRFNSHMEDMAYFSRNLKLLCSEKKLRVFCPHQVNRSGQEQAKQGDRIEIRHLKFGGEQDPDNILIIQPFDGEVDIENLSFSEGELTLAKQRKGRAGLLRHRFNKSLGRFDDMPGTGQRSIPLGPKRALKKGSGKALTGAAKGDPSNDANDGGPPF